MRMQKEEKVVLVLLLMALGSLYVAFWAFEVDKSASVGSPTAGADSSLSVDGRVLEIKPTKSGGNLLVRIDTTPMQIFVPAKAGASDIEKHIHTGDRVRVRGTVSQYRGKDELTVARSADFQSMGD